MSNLSPESEPQSDLTAQVMTEARAAYVTLRELLDKSTTTYYRKEEDTPEGVALAAAIGKFVANHTDALGNIGAIERTPQLQSAANAWLEKRLEQKLETAIYVEIASQKEEELTDLLRGHTVKATSLTYGFGVADRYGLTSGPDNPREITAPFFAVEPTHGVIWLGTGERHYQVRLWDSPENMEPVSTIEVL